jgi:hypothetical protein
MVDQDAYFSMLFDSIESRFGPFETESLSSIVGFSAGGPVSLSTNEKSGVFCTCELSLYPEQKPSAENLRYELLVVKDFPEEVCRRLLTTLGNLSMNAVLGDGHTIDMSGVFDGEPRTVRLALDSSIDWNGEGRGIYQVRPLKP